MAGFHGCLYQARFHMDAKDIQQNDPHILRFMLHHHYHHFVVPHTIQDMDWRQSRSTFALTTAIAIYTLIYCWDSLQVLLINGIGTVKLQTYVVIIGLILHIPLSLLLGKFLGAIGVVTSMSIINIIYCIFFTAQIRKLLSRKASGIWIQ